MLFTDFKFFLIMPLIFVLYWILPNKFKWLKKSYLLVVSYLFYMNFSPAYALLLLSVSLIAFGGAKLVENGVIFAKRGWIVVILMPLLIFKYYNFINESVFSFLTLFHLRFQLPGLNWAVPVGISFFTFQALGYYLDVYYKRIHAEKNLLDYLLFVSFFPQIASGPISKAQELIPQIKNISPFVYDKAVKGLRYFLWGLFLKIAIADRAGLYVSLVLDHYDNFSGINCLLASFLYSIQIYTDFAGYSFMAIGVGKLLGFDLINNFNHPYFSMSITDFWRRWHISLSRWLKDYVYIPLGGNRCSKIRNYINIVITFLVSGIWHGANWTFVVWGLFHGVCQVVEKAVGLQKSDSMGFIRVVRVGITFVIVSFAWVFFRSPSVIDACHIILQIGTLYKGFNISLIGDSMLAYLFIAMIPFCAFEIIHEFYPLFYSKLMARQIVRWGIYVSILSLILLIGVFDGSQFIYANF